MNLINAVQQFCRLESIFSLSVLNDRLYTTGMMHLKIGCTICFLQITTSHPSGTNSGYCLEQILEDLIPVEYSVQIRMLVFSSQVVLLFSAVTLGCLSNLPVINPRFSCKRVRKADECSVTAANCWAVLELLISYRYIQYICKFESSGI